MADTGTSHHHGGPLPGGGRTLRQAIQRSGYYPELVAEGIEFATAGEPIHAYLVHQETTLDAEAVRRHVTVLALTPTRLLVGHTDEHGPDEHGLPDSGAAPAPAAPTNPTSHATTSTESVPLHRVTTVVLSRTVADPARHVVGAPPSEAVLTVGWGAVNRVDLEPAACGDPSCEADHGYTGTMTTDDLSLRVSEAGDGREAVAEMVAFATALSRAVGTGAVGGAAG